MNKIIEILDADICLISSWCCYFSTDEECKLFLNSRGIVVDNVYLGDSHNRPKFVLEEKEKGITEYLIIDDESFLFRQEVPNIEHLRILTPNPYRCLDKFDYIFILKIISRLKVLTTVEENKIKKLERKLYTWKKVNVTNQQQKN